MKQRVYSTDGEIFNDEWACYDNGDTYWSGYKREIKPSDLVDSYHINTLFEGMLERLYDEVGDLADGGMEMTMAEQDNLLYDIKELVDKRLLVSCYAVDNIKEHVMSDEDEF